MVTNISSENYLWGTLGEAPKIRTFQDTIECQPFWLWPLTVKHEWKYKGSASANSH